MEKMDDLSQYIYINKTQSSQNMESSEEIELSPENIQIIYSSAQNQPVVYEERIDQPELFLLTGVFKFCIENVLVSFVEYVIKNSDSISTFQTKKLIWIFLKS